MSQIKLYKHKWIWDKVQSGSFQNSKYMPLQIEEDILVFCKGGKVNYFPIMRKGKMKIKGGAKNDKGQYLGLKHGYSVKNDNYYPVNILTYPNCSNKHENTHPTQKPVDLFRYLIKTYSNEGETVFDGYMGSGTTAIACIEEKRNFIGSENVKEYYDIATKRIENKLLQLKLF